MILRTLTALSLLFLLVLLGPLTGSAQAFTGAACGSDCTSCHNLNKEEAGILLKTNKFGATVKEIRMSPIKGLWEVELEMKNGQRAIINMDFAKQYLIENLKLTKLSRIGKPSVATRMIDVDSIPLDDAIIMGNPKADKRIIVFDDPDCPFCRRLHVEIKKMLETRKDIAAYIIQFPLPMHEKAFDKSKALICDKSLELLDDVMSGKTIPASTCETDGVERNIVLGRSLGINSTPTIIFSDGRVLSGVASAKDLEELIDNKE